MRIFQSTVVLFAVLTAPLLTARGAVTTPGTLVADLPAKMDFAGERTPLERRDTRESLTREVLVTACMHSRTTMTLLASRRYLPLIRPILAAQEVPDDFVYLCMAESGFNPEAVSSAGAAGLWQLMPAIAHEYGLLVDKDIDERFHVEKSTEAACKYLKQAFLRVGSWSNAAASYNLGISGVATRLEKQGTQSYYDAFFPEETLRYMFRILSFKLIAGDPWRYGFDIAQENYHTPLPVYMEEEIGGKDIDWPAVARARGVTFKALRELNPWIRSYDCKNIKGHVFKVKFPLPEGK